jgi:exosortase
MSVAANPDTRLEGLPLRSWILRYGPHAIVLASFAPLCFIHFWHLWQNEQYQHFPLVIAAAFYLGWLRMQECVSAAHDGTSLPGRVLLSIAFVFLAVASVAWSPVLGMVGAILAIAAMLFCTTDAATIRQFVPVWMLLWLVVPPPLQMDHVLALHLQRLASMIASAFLDLAGCNHVLTGNVIELPGQRFLVEEACSGIHSLFAMIALVAIFVVWQRRSLLPSLLLIAATPGWAVSVNALRVCLVVLARDRLDVDLASGAVHQILGIAVFLVGLAFLFLTDRLLLGLFAFGAPSKADSQGLDDSPRSGVSASIGAQATRFPSPESERARRLSLAPRRSWMLASFFALCVFLQAQPFLREFEVHDLSRRDAIRFSRELANLTLPDRLGDWSRVARSPNARNEGAKSLSDSYACGNQVAEISVAYAFVGWHELTECYRGNGWLVESWRRMDLRGDKMTVGLTDVEVTMTQPGQAGGQHGYLLFSEYDAEGQPIPPPKRDCSLACRLKEEFCNRLLRRMPGHGLDRPTCQLQVLWTGPTPATPEERRRTQGLYAQAASLLSKYLHDS